MRLSNLSIIALLLTSSTAFADRVDAPQSGALSTSTQVVDDAATGWIWSGMESYDDSALHGGAAHAGGPGSFGAYTFHGVAVDVYGVSGAAVDVDGRSHKVGSLRISIDGKQVATSSERGAGSDLDYNVGIAHIDGLSDGNHVLQVEPEAGWGVVDYIVIQTSLTSGSPAAETKPVSVAIPDGYYRLVPRHAPDKCLDVADPSCVNGANLQIYSWSGSRAQVWHIVSLGDSLYRVSAATARAQSISVETLSSTNNDPQAVVWTYGDNDPRQQMLIRPVDGYYRIGPASDTDETLDVCYKGTDNGTKVLGYSWNGGPNQEWTLMPVSAP